MQKQPNDHPQHEDEGAAPFDLQDDFDKTIVHRRPTKAEEGLAANRLLQLARMGLAGGIVGFMEDGWVVDALGLLPDIYPSTHGAYEARVPNPANCGDDTDWGGELERACKQEIHEALTQRSRVATWELSQAERSLNKAIKTGNAETAGYCLFRAAELMGAIEDEKEEEEWRRRFKRKQTAAARMKPKNVTPLRVGPALENLGD